MKTVTLKSGEQVEMNRAHPTGRALGYYLVVDDADSFDDMHGEYLGRTQAIAKEYLARKQEGCNK